MLISAGSSSSVGQYKDAFMKANPGYKWWPTTNQPVKARTSTVTNRKKLWAFASDSAKGLPSLGKATKSEGMPQRNFGTAGFLEYLPVRCD
ncbi:HMG box transcription factor BBX-like [Phalacrocorax carbo]|uniref:HMG box transcription factor BBX-like n=1 Tax=Phalacrocorax carbo TaxID=9209 RepID=UPI003119DB6A